jgi:putative membrane protein
MRNVFLLFSLVVFVALACALPAHGQKQQPGTAKDAFLSKAIEMNQAELGLSRMAQGKAQDTKVKEYADMMVQDHTEALEKLRSAAGVSENQVPLTKQHQEMSDRLAGLTGDGFDKAYMEAMVRDHQQAVQTFQREVDSGGGATATRQKPGTNAKNDAEIARELLPTLQKHLNSAEQINQTIGRTGAEK